MSTTTRTLVREAPTAAAEGGAAPYLRIVDITKNFGDFTALDSVSIDIHDGEFVCFLGPSGCGKTTLLRAIAGLDIQTYGRIEQAGRDISALPPSERDFGIVFQSYALFPNLTVTRNVGYGLENRKLPRSDIAGRVRELLQLVGLEGQDDKYPAQLSGGQQQRVALARALATSPGLLLLDEPLSALDARVRVRLRHEIRQLQNRLGVTTIMVTHDQEEALTMADRIVVMNHGVIEQVGTPEEIYRSPATAFVADFIGTMNFAPGALVEDGLVRIGKISLACASDGFAAGDRVQVSIRPEDIVARDVRAGQPNAFVATVGHLEFLGSSVRVELAGADLGDAHLTASLSVNLMRELQLEPGHAVTVRVPAERIRLYAAARG